MEVLFGERADELARETRCMKRERKFRGSSLARILVFGWMENGQITLERLSQIAQYSKVVVSDNGILDYPRPRKGIPVAITVINGTLTSSGRLAI